MNREQVKAIKDHIQRQFPHNSTWILCQAIELKDYLFDLIDNLDCYKGIMKKEEREARRKLKDENLQTLQKL